MKHTAARLNRTCLVVLGVLLLLLGLTGILLGLGLLTPLARRAGLQVAAPDAGQRLLGGPAAEAFGLTWVVALTAAVGLVTALLGLAWLLAQIPRAHQARPFRLHDDAATGLTRLRADVLTDAVEAQTKALPGVTDADAVLRGTASQPDLTLRVTANDRADLPQLLEQLHHQVAGDLGEALDTRVRRLGVQLEVTSTKSHTKKITL